MNTIKTKIGFDIKPNLTEATNVYELRAFSLRTLGILLMSSSTLCSGGAAVFLKYYHASKNSELQKLHQQCEQLETRHTQLINQYEKLTELTSIQSQLEPLAMRPPKEAECVFLPQNFFKEMNHAE